jgi:predicted Zn-dependent protease
MFAPLFKHLSLVFMLLMLLAGCAANPVTGRQELALVTVSNQEEVDLGQKSYPKVLQKMGGQFQDLRLDQYLQQVGMKLARVSHRPDLPYQFKVVNDSTPNAFALPGGPIAISRGLLVGIDNEAQLAAILGHEIGHVTARHAVQGMQRGTVLGLGLSVISGSTGDAAYGPLAQQAGQLAASLINNTYSRDQESESDRLGIDYMAKAGYNPLGAVQVQAYFYSQIEKGANPNWLTGLFRTHPFSKDRMLANEQYVRSHFAAELKTLPFNREAFQQATLGIRQLQPGYDLYDQARAQEIKGDLRGAIAGYLNAAALAPDQPLILTGLGMAYLKADDLKSARQHLARAVHLDSGYYQSRLGLGYIYLEEGQTDLAVNQLKQSLELLPTGQGAFLLAEGYAKQGNKQQAKELYKAVAEADPSGQLGKTAATRAQALGQ